MIYYQLISFNEYLPKCWCVQLDSLVCSLFSRVTMSCVCFIYGHLGDRRSSTNFSAIFPVLALDLEGVHDVKLHHPSSSVATSNQ